jgi:hypothetical protein
MTQGTCTDEHRHKHKHTHIPAPTAADASGPRRIGDMGRGAGACRASSKFCESPAGDRTHTAIASQRVESRIVQYVYCQNLL